jgi:hypothetical protein
LLGGCGPDRVYRILTPGMGGFTSIAFEGDDRARIPQPSSFRRVTGGGEQYRASTFGAGGDDVHRHFVDARLDSSFTAIVGDRPIAHTAVRGRGHWPPQGVFPVSSEGALLLGLRRVQIVSPLGSYIGLSK